MLKNNVLRKLVLPLVIAGSIAGSSCKDVTRIVSGNCTSYKHQVEKAESSPLGYEADFVYAQLARPDIDNYKYDENFIAMLKDRQLDSISDRAKNLYVCDARSGKLRTLQEIMSEDLKESKVFDKLKEANVYIPEEFRKDPVKATLFLNLYTGSTPLGNWEMIKYHDTWIGLKDILDNSKDYPLEVGTAREYHKAMMSELKARYLYIKPTAKDYTKFGKLLSGFIDNIEKLQ